MNLQIIIPSDHDTNKHIVVCNRAPNIYLIARSRLYILHVKDCPEKCTTPAASLNFPPNSVPTSSAFSEWENHRKVNKSC